MGPFAADDLKRECQRLQNQVEQLKRNLAEARIEQPKTSFQNRVDQWMLNCFNDEIAYSQKERNHRFLEEALELVQSLGCTEQEVYQLVNYVYNRKVGSPMQEAGGVLVCLAALCTAAEMNMNEAGEKELVRIWGKVETIRAKHAAKPQFSPLPGGSCALCQPRLSPGGSHYIHAANCQWAIKHNQPREGITK